ncbi:class I tRNA ligase family protein, partial [candidate division GN15 bacterium]|nr:class I tRNA ligase family protein [candidate division GN15 bacterium]
NEQAPFDSAKANAWLPIDLYVGGITHATGHLIYFRFFHKVMHDMGLLDSIEPATRLFNHGMVMDAHGEVMSKSKGNVVSPLDLMDERGVDVSRLAMYFTAPSEKEVLWSSETITGVEKFVYNKLFPIHQHHRGSNPDLKRYFNQDELTKSERSIYVKLNQSIKKVSESFDRLQFNTAIAALMELIRDFERTDIGNDELNDQIVLKTIQMVAPLAPHLAEELWEALGHQESVFQSTWPEFDEDAVQGELIEIAVQVNGKLRDTVKVPPDADQETVEAEAFASDKVKSFTDGKGIIKKIYVPGRIFNIVAK